MDDSLRNILVKVRAPFRYVGGEAGCRRKDWNGADLRVCLVFPDVYELGMSHLGLSIIYNIVNNEDGMLADRAFAPWGDMEEELKKRKMELFALESKKRLADFDMIGFSLAYELTYTNVLTILKLSGIPLRAKNRGEDDPLIVAGGPCMFNPEPVAPFFDAIAIGDGEDAALEIARTIRESKKLKLKRRETLERLSQLTGVYVPMLGAEKFKGRAFVNDINAASFPSAPVVPHAATQMRFAVEVARGCTRGCRFCQAGYIYRPARQRGREVAAGLASSGVLAGGAEEFSFLSLSVCDWAPLAAALRDVHRQTEGLPVDATLPSLRAEALSGEVLGLLGNARSGSFTLAPEAATEKMRRRINKGNTDADLYASVEKVFSLGWHAVKLYFMVGLPCETDAEIDGIIEISNRCLDIGRRHHRRPEVTVSTSTFVPKAHTPFQWERQITIEETLEIQRKLKRHLRRPGIFYRWHTPEMSFLEGVFSRGGSELADAIEFAHENGARFDGWDEGLKFEVWREAFLRAGIVPEKYLEARAEDFVFPWEKLHAGPTREFLKKERVLAHELQNTPDCSSGACSACGICDFDQIKNRIADTPAWVCEKNPSPVAKTGEARPATFKYRVRYTKTEESSFLGSIETLDAVRRAFRASGLKLIYSEGYHPRPKIGSGPALPVGVESMQEFVDVELAFEIPPEEIVEKLEGRLPFGMTVVHAQKIGPETPSIEESVAVTRYEVDLSGLVCAAAEVVEKFSSLKSLPYLRKRGEKVTEIDLMGHIAGLAVISGHVLGVSLANVRPQVKVSEVVKVLMNLDDEEAALLKVKKTEVEWKRNVE